MEKGPSASNPSADSGSDDNDNDEEVEEDEEDGVMYQDNIRNGSTNTRSRVVYGNGIGGCSSGGSGFRIKFPTGVSIAKPGTGFRSKNFDQIQNQNPNPSPSPGGLRDYGWTRPVLGKRCKIGRAHV